MRARGEGLLVSTVGRTAQGGQAWDWSPLTYEGFLVILCSQAIASGEEGVSISLVKPRQIPEVETQAHLWRQLLKGLGRTQKCRGAPPQAAYVQTPRKTLPGTPNPLARPNLISISRLAQLRRPHPFPPIKAYATQEAFRVHTIV